MTASDIYLSAINGWMPPTKSQQQERSPEKEQKGVVVDFLAAKARLSGRTGDPMRE